jgi:Ca2+-binding RTX toxin-like protein
MVRSLSRGLLVCALAAAVVLPAEMSAADDPRDGSVRASACTILGGAKSDVLVGTNKADTICAFKGNDRIRGRGGKDIIYAGRGADRIDGGKGRDRIYGGPGNDRITARDRKRDIVGGGPGKDRATVDRTDSLRGVEKAKRPRKKR